MKKTNGTIFITGASGFIGKYAVKYFLERNWKVIALFRKTHLQNFKKNARLIIIQGDITDLKFLIKATKKVNYILHLAGAKSDEKYSYQVNVLGTQNVIKAAELNCVKKIIYVSTLSTKIKKRGTYGKTKLIAEKKFSDCKVPYTILRPSVVYAKEEEGVFGAILKYSKLPVTPVFGNGKTVFYPIHVEDLVKSMEIALTRKNTSNKSYDVGGPDKVSLNSLIYKISEVLGNNSIVIHIPALLGIYVGKTLSKIVNRPPITESNVLGSIQDIKVDLEKYFSDFNFIPRSFIKGLWEVLEGKDYKTKEAKVFLRYGIYKKYLNVIDDGMINLYKKGVQEYKLEYFKTTPSVFVLGLIDAFSKIFFPNSVFQKKMKLVAAIIETSKFSAGWLLPKNKAFLTMVFEVFLVFSSTFLKLLLGFMLYLIPGFYKRYGF